MTDQIETEEDTGEGNAAFYRRWMMEIAHADKASEDWRRKCQRIIKRYRDEESRSGARFNILYSNTETLRGAVYQRAPKPSVRRRRKGVDPVSREIAQVIEAALIHNIDESRMHSVMSAVVEDYLLTGRGLARTRYVPSFEQTRDLMPIGSGDDVPADDEELVVGEGGQLMRYGEPYDTVVYEETEDEYVPWDRFVSDQQPQWRRKRWIAFKHLLRREELRAKFPGVGDQITLDGMPDGSDQGDDGEKQFFMTATVWELWDKQTREVIWLSPGYKEAVLDREEDPLGLKDFFPVPEPCTWSKTNDNNDPIPPYLIYQDHAKQLDLLQERKQKLAKEMKRRGVTVDDENGETMRRLAKAGDNEFVPIKNFAALAGKGGISAYFMELPIEALARTILAIDQQIEAEKQAIYEITGISDIVRGATKASETATAQDIKARFGSQRIGPKVEEVARFSRDLIRNRAEIMAELFAPETLSLISGYDVTEEMAQIMRDDHLRSYAVDVETDSTIAADASEERADRIEFITALTQFVSGWAPMVQAGMVSPDTLRSILLFGVRAFPTARELEDEIEALGQQQQAPPPMMPEAPPQIPPQGMPQ